MGIHVSLSIALLLAALVMTASAVSLSQFVRYKDSFLPVTSISTSNQPDAELCAERCLANANCVSFNYAADLSSTPANIRKKCLILAADRASAVLSTNANDIVFWDYFEKKVSCTPDYFLSITAPYMESIGNCLNISTCNAGQFQTAEPTLTSDRRCSSCSYGSYQNLTNQPACIPWSSCKAGTYQSGFASSTRDTPCTVCGPGSYQPYEDRFFCYPVSTCSVGSYIFDDYTTTSNRECQPCPSETYQNKTNQIACIAWSSGCLEGLVESKPPSSSSDRVCSVPTTTTTVTITTTTTSTSNVPTTTTTTTTAPTTTITTSSTNSPTTTTTTTPTTTTTTSTTATTTTANSATTHSSSATTTTPNIPSTTTTTTANSTTTTNTTTTTTTAATTTTTTTTTTTKAPTTTTTTKAPTTTTTTTKAPTTTTKAPTTTTTKAPTTTTKAPTTTTKAPTTTTKAPTTTTKAPTTTTKAPTTTTKAPSTTTTKLTTTTTSTTITTEPIINAESGASSSANSSIGIAIGSVFGVIVGALVLVVAVKRRKASQAEQPPQPEDKAANGDETFQRTVNDKRFGPAAPGEPRRNPLYRSMRARNPSNVALDIEPAADASKLRPPPNSNDRGSRPLQLVSTRSSDKLYTEPQLGTPDSTLVSSQPLTHQYSSPQDAVDSSTVRTLRTRPGQNATIPDEEREFYGTIVRQSARELPKESIQLCELIGRGEFGMVHRGQFTDGGKETMNVAVKLLNSPEPDDRTRLIQEAMLMATLDHPNILRLLGVVTKSDPLMLVLEYMPDGALDGVLHTREFTLAELLKFSMDICSAMVYLENNRYIHRDLAARNVLVRGDVCKVCDFGFSHELEKDRDYYQTTTRLPLRWCAVETLNTRRHTTSSDVWSFGVLLWEIFSKGAFPYQSWSNARVTKEIALGNRLVQPDGCPFSVFEIMILCWHPKPEERPSFQIIMSRLQLIQSTKILRTKVTPPPNIVPHAVYMNTPQGQQAQSWLKHIQTTIIHKHASRRDSATQRDDSLNNSTSHYCDVPAASLKLRTGSVSGPEDIDLDSTVTLRRDVSSSSGSSIPNSPQVKRPLLDKYNIAKLQTIVSRAHVLPPQGYLKRASTAYNTLLGNSSLSEGNDSGVIVTPVTLPTPDPEWVFQGVTSEEAINILDQRAQHSYLIRRADHARAHYIIHIVIEGSVTEVSLVLCVQGWYVREHQVAPFSKSLRDVLIDLSGQQGPYQLPLGQIVSPQEVPPSNSC